MKFYEAVLAILNCMHMYGPACATVILGCTFVGNGPASNKLIGGPVIFSLHLIVVGTGL